MIPTRSDVINKDEVFQILKENEKGKNEREEFMKKEGYPAYTTEIGLNIYSNFVVILFS